MKQITKQVAAYARLVGFCNTLGPVYKPSKANIKIAALNAMLTHAQGSIDAAIKYRDAFENAVSARKQIFAQSRPLASRVVNALIACGASDETIAYARGVKRVFSNPARKNKLPESAPVSAPGDAGNQSTTQRRSQTGFEIKTTNFARLVEKLATEKLYKPNEVDLQLTSLKAFLKTMHDATSNVIAATLAMKNGRAAQRQLLFGKEGVHGTAMETKRYIQSVFGTYSDQYREVGPLRFSKIKN